VDWRANNAVQRIGDNMVDWREVEIGGTVEHEGVLFKKVSQVFGLAENGDYMPFGRWQDVVQVGWPARQQDLFGDDDSNEERS